MDNLNSLWNLLDQGDFKFTDVEWKNEYYKLLTSPVNANASVNAKALLQKLYSLQGKTILTGQHEYLEVPYQYAAQIFNATGKWPTIKGVEFGGITGQSETTLASQRQNVIEAAKGTHNTGGYVTATYHAAYPGSAQTWANVQRYTTQDEFNQIITPGTSLYNALISDLDKVAVYLKQLAVLDIPVLWRPYHEMNGGWFWWGQKNNFVELWDIMYDRFTKYHRLNNLIWVWCPNAKNAWCDPIVNFYVGHGKTDVLALDIYDNDFKQSHHDELWALGKGKLIAIGENGQLPNPATLSTTQNKYSWHLTWASLLNEKNSAATINSFYNNSYVLNRGQVYVEPPVVVPEPEIVNGLTGQYYAGTNFETLKETRIDPNINFMWNQTAPFPSMTVDNFTVRWTGFVKPLFTEEYTFYTKTDDGARLWINDVLIVDQWNKQSFIEWSGKITLEANKKYSIKMEFLEIGGDARSLLYWSSPSQTKQIVPQSQLFVN